MKPSMSDTNLAEAGHFFYKSKNAFDYSGGSDAAVDLTSGRVTTGQYDIAIDPALKCHYGIVHLVSG